MLARRSLRRALLAAVLAVPLLANAAPHAAPVQLDLQQSVVVLDHLPTATDLALLPTGAVGVPYQPLPMIAVQGTAAQFRLIGRLAGVTSVWPNRTIKYALHESVPLIGADQVWQAP